MDRNLELVGRASRNTGHHGSHRGRRSLQGDTNDEPCVLSQAPTPDLPESHEMYKVKRISLNRYQSPETALNSTKIQAVYIVCRVQGQS